TTFQAGILYSLTLSIILDSDPLFTLLMTSPTSTTSKGPSPRTHGRHAGSSEVPMLGYGDVDQDRRVIRPSTTGWRQRNSAYQGRCHLHRPQYKQCVVRLASRKGILQWDNKRKNNFLNEAWPEKTTQSCTRWRSAMDNRLSTGSYQEALIQHLLQVAYLVGSLRLLQETFVQIP